MLKRKPFLQQCFTILMLIVVLGMLLSSCSGTATPTSGPEQITYTFLDGPPKDLQLVEDALNKILIPKINVKVKLNPLDWAVYEQKVKLNFASNQTCDVLWTAPWMNNYYQNVSNGNLLAIDALLPKDAPQLYASMSKSIWNAAKVNGKIYGVINQQIFANQVGFNVRKDLADKYGLNVSTIHSYTDLEPFLAQIKQHEPDVIPVLDTDKGLGMISALNIDTFAALPIGVRFNDPSVKAISVFESPEYKQAIEMARNWYKKGYVQDPDKDAYSKYDTGKYAVVISQVIKPGGITDWKNQHPSYDTYQQAITKPIITTGAVVSTLNAVCRSSQHPDASLRFLNEINTNPEAFNLLSKGIENKHWVWKDKTKKVISTPAGVDPKNIGYSTVGDWMFGNQFNAYYSSEAQVGSWDETKQLNASAKPSPALGFSLDTRKIKTQAATISSVMTQYFTPLEEGIVDPNTELPKAIQALKDAGLEDVLTETQSQIDAWKKTS